MRKPLLVLALLCTTATAQPIFQVKQVEIAPRPATPVTRSGDLMAASVITLQFDNAPLRDVLAALAPQIDAGITLQGTNDGVYRVPSLDWFDTTRITIHLQRASFWDAVAAIVKATPIPLDPQPKEGMLFFVEHAEDSTALDWAPHSNLLAMISAPGARRIGGLLLAPLVLNIKYGDADQTGTHLFIHVAAEPRIHGVSQLAVLHLRELTASDGTSLIDSTRDFLTDFNRSAGDYARWAFRIRSVAENIVIRKFSGDMRIATGPKGQGTFDLAKMFTPIPLDPGIVQTDEECQIFRAPNFNDPRGTYTSKDREFPNECRVVGSHHRIPGLDSPAIHGRRVDYTEERTLVMHNITKSPETFVVWTIFPPDTVNFTSEPKPVQVQEHGEYRVQVAPGETERLHIGYEVDQQKEDEMWKKSVHAVNRIPPAPKKLQQQATVGDVRITLTGVAAQNGEYVLNGEFSSPVDGPVQYACPEYCQYLGIDDTAGHHTGGIRALAPVTIINNRAVMQWSLTTVGRGLVPSKLVWSMEPVTRWLTISLR